jgi:hypothetical protein
VYRYPVNNSFKILLEFVPVCVCLQQQEAWTAGAQHVGSSTRTAVL